MKALEKEYFFLRHPTLKRMGLVGIALLLTGCAGTFSDVKPLAAGVGAPPPQRPSTLLLGEIKISDARISPADAQSFIYALRRGINEWNLTHHAFQSIADQVPGAVPPQALVLTGNITDVEKGNLAMRWIVGMGAGQARLVGDFVFFDDQGKRLGGFTAQRSYLGGAGAGGGDLLTTEDLFVRLGDEVAESTDKWLKAEHFD